MPPIWAIRPSFRSPVLNPILATIYLHVGGGTLWTLASVSLVIRRRADTWLVAAQMIAALTTLAAGVRLWHVLHAGGMGSVEHLLIVGTFCAFVALGLQIAVAGPAFLGRGGTRAVDLAVGPLVLEVVAAAFLVLAASAMIGARYA